MRTSVTYLRNFVFGVEDGIVSTVGLLTGVAIGGVSREALILTGVILVVVEAFSMAVGSFLSESTTEEFEDKKGRRKRHSLSGGLIMFVSYFAAGLIPLVPYLALTGNAAIRTSIFASLAALFILGIVSGTLTRGNVLWHGVRMALVGGLAVLVGVGAAFLLAQYGVVAS